MSRVTLLFIVVLAAPPASAQTLPQGIHFGSTELMLGSRQDSVLALLAEQYDVQSLGEPHSSWFVRSKGAPPYTYYGSLYFENRRLVNVRKSWSPADQARSFEFANALYGAAASLVAEGRTRCTLSVDQGQEPTVERKAVYLSCGSGRSLAILVLKLPDGSSATLDEVLQKP